MPWLDDATCVVEPYKISRYAFDIATASAFNVTEAARAVILECVVRRRVGGVSLSE